jgi:DNA uptake protein ComE-like DNA-binding protein
MVNGGPDRLPKTGTYRVVIFSRTPNLLNDSTIEYSFKLSCHRQYGHCKMKDYGQLVAKKSVLGVVNQSSREQLRSGLDLTSAEIDRIIAARNESSVKTYQRLIETTGIDQTLTSEILAKLMRTQAVIDGERPDGDTVAADALLGVLNSANAGQFEELGLSPDVASAIIDYRSSNGLFDKPSKPLKELDDVLVTHLRHLMDRIRDGWLAPANATEKSEGLDFRDSILLGIFNHATADQLERVEGVTRQAADAVAGARPGGGFESIEDVASLNGTNTQLPGAVFSHLREQSALAKASFIEAESLEAYGLLGILQKSLKQGTLSSVGYPGKAGDSIRRAYDVSGRITSLDQLLNLDGVNRFHIGAATLKANIEVF